MTISIELTHSWLRIQKKKKTYAESKQHFAFLYEQICSYLIELTFLRKILYPYLFIVYVRHP